MRFTPDNFLRLVKDVVTGTNSPVSNGSQGVQGADGGFNLDVRLDLGDMALGSTSIITVDGNGTPVLQTGVSSTQGSTNTFGTISFQVPRDYDQNSDHLILRLVADSNGTTDTPTITVAASTVSLTSTGSTYAAPVAATSSTTAALNNTPTIYEIDLSGNKLVRDTLVTAKITTSNHNTDKANLYAMELVYASCLIAFVDEMTTAGKAVGYDVLGNPLR